MLTEGETWQVLEVLPHLINNVYLSITSSATNKSVKSKILWKFTLRITEEKTLDSCTATHSTEIKHCVSHNKNLRSRSIIIEKTAITGELRWATPGSSSMSMSWWCSRVTSPRPRAGAWHGSWCRVWSRGRSWPPPRHQSSWTWTKTGKVTIIFNQKQLDADYKYGRGCVKSFLPIPLGSST